jgi:GT2 family glycosyltransferase
MARVTINIVTCNSVAEIDACLTSVFGQDYTDHSVTVIDNCSQDGTLTALEAWRERGVTIRTNNVNLYYSRAHNDGIRASDSEFIVTLNPDVIIRSDFLTHVMVAFERSPRIGSINGKLLLHPKQTNVDLVSALPIETTVIDSAGLMMYKSRRPFLRGNRKPSGRHCAEPCYIFGADGACAVYRRTMLEDVAVGGEYFDDDFVIYREDVDLAWRAQLYGWDAYYVPTAVGYHRRGFHPGQKRGHISSYLKRQSVKNGWLLVIKNDTLKAVTRDSLHISRYQLKVVAGMIGMEHSSLGAIPDLLKLMPRMRYKRREIQSKRRRSDEELRVWFE